MPINSDTITTTWLQLQLLVQVTFATMGIGAAKDLGAGLHIRTSDTGGDAEIQVQTDISFRKLIITDAELQFLQVDDDASITLILEMTGDNQYWHDFLYSDGNFLRFKTNTVN